MSKRTIIYIGMDRRYWDGLQKKFNSTYGGSEEFDFHNLTEIEDQGYVKLYRKIKEL